MGILWLTLNSLAVSAQSPSYLSAGVSLIDPEIPLAEALRSLGRQTGTTISYNSSMIDPKRKIGIRIRSRPLREALQLLLGDQLADLDLTGNFITIKLVRGRGGLNGHVMSKDSEPLAYATVSIKGIAATQADSLGYYQFTRLLPGNYTVEVSYVGEMLQSSQAEVSANRNSILNFELEKKGRYLEAVTVTGKTEAREIKESGFNVTAIEVKKYANSNTDINQILNRSPGVMIRESGGLGSDFTFAINGLSGRYVRFFIDGVPMENLGQAFNLNNFPINLVERIDVYKGVVPGALGSDALGGAVNIVTNRQIRHFLDVSYSYGSFNTHRSSLTAQYKDAKTGITLLAKGFYNYSDNNYKMRNDPAHGVFIEVAENGKWVAQDGLRRFYDRYKSGMGQLEAGISDKKWADRFTIGMAYAAYNKQIQTGATVSDVKGGRYMTGHTLTPSLHYSKSSFLSERLSLQVNSSLGYDVYAVRDTSSYAYDWSGKYITPLPPHKNAPYGYRYSNRSVLSRLNADYNLGPLHSLSFTYNANLSKRSTENELYPGDPTTGPDNHLQKHIAGLTLNSGLLGQRLSNNLFLKYYGVNASKNILSKTETVKDAQGNSRVVRYYNSKREYISNYGYGMATRFLISLNWGLKTSVEKAYRLQDVTDLFGDGQYYLGNQDLKPESSYNFNVGTFFSHRNTTHQLSADASVFFRDARDFIYTRITLSNDPLTSELAQYTQPYNAGKVQVKGMEADVKYNYKNILNAGFNATWQVGIDNRRFNDGVTSHESITYRNKIPNQPWLFGNADIGIGKDGLLGKQTRLQLDWFTRYVHWFYLSWEALGSKESKNKIPSQLVHNASLTASWENGKYNLSFESRNLNDEIVYDNFRLQKSGRAFYAKFRCLLR